MHIHKGDTFTVVFQTVASGTITRRWFAEVPVGTPEEEAYGLLQDKITAGDVAPHGVARIKESEARIVPGSVEDAT